jgi:hypothetical protein
MSVVDFLTIVRPKMKQPQLLGEEPEEIIGQIR